jgi:hypothetical protein
VYGYPSSDHSQKKEMKTAQVYLETSDGKLIKFCPEGNGRYIKCPNIEEELNIEKTQQLIIQIKHKSYSNRQITFLRYPFNNKGSAFTFYLFKPQNYQLDSAYINKGASLFCEQKNCNSTIDRAVSYYEIAEKYLSTSTIPDVDTKKTIMYNIGRANLNAWQVLDYDTCYKAYNYYSQVNSLLGDGQTQINNNLRLLLVKDGYLIENSQKKTTIKKQDIFCKK